MRYLAPVAASLLLVFVGLGLVFPQIANLRMHGSLLLGQIALLGLGLLVSLTGIGGMVYTSVGRRGYRMNKP